MRTTIAAAGVPPAAEGGRVAARNCAANRASAGAMLPGPAGQDARLHGRPEARRYGPVAGFLAFLVLLCACTFQATGQQIPHLAYVYPAGGRSGTTFQIVVGGQYLLTVSNALFTIPDIKATVLECNRPMNQKEFNELRDRLKGLQDKWQSTRKGNSGTNVWSAADGREREQIRERILKNPPNRTANPAMIDTVTLQVSIASNAVPGKYELRLDSRAGLSNPVWFYVGSLPEVSKPVSRAANPELDRFLERLGKVVASGTPKYEGRCSLPATVNGQIMPGGVDHYRFLARRGQHLVLSVGARALIPYLADAVPGWFEPILLIRDAGGKELASAERYRFHSDPLLHFDVPRDGEYVVEIHDSIFRGREDFVYRFTLGELPFITDVFPLGGKAGEFNTVALRGWNLPVDSLDLDCRTNLAGTVFMEDFIAPDKFASRTPFELNDLPECVSPETNNSCETAQPVAMPVIVNGRISKPGNLAVFRFEGHAGQKIVAEVVARRLNSPLDSVLELKDAEGTRLAFNDDFEDPGCGLETHHADSYLMAILPREGNYYLQLGDAQGQGGAEFSYRLRLSEARPDFALRVTPSSLTVRAGMSVPLVAYAIRKDGFTNAIELALKTAPRGLSLSGARIPANQDKAQFTLKAAPGLAGDRLALAIEGRAVVNGQTVTRTALPADERMQAFAYRHLVPASELELLVSPNPRPFASDALKILSSTPVRIPAGGIARVRIATPGPVFVERFELELENPPEGIAIKEVSPVTDGVELALVSDASRTKMGATGNLIVNVRPRMPSPGTQLQKGANQRRNLAGVLPAIPFRVVAD